MEPLAEKGVRAYSNLYAHLPAPEEDTPIGRVLRAAPPASLLDATGLLWRLELSGISVLCRQGLSDSARARLPLPFPLSDFCTPTHVQPSCLSFGLNLKRSLAAGSNLGVLCSVVRLLGCLPVQAGFRWAHLANAWDVVSPDAGPDGSALLALVAHRLTPLEVILRSRCQATQ
jgi:hypothetical protein